MSSLPITFSPQYTHRPLAGASHLVDYDRLYRLGLFRKSPLAMADFAHVDHDATDWPAWGTLGLDVFLLQSWDSGTSSSENEQRAQLVRKYVASGRLKRQSYMQKAATNPPQPSEAQVSQILQPLRSPALRHVADKLMRGNEIWLRTDYQSDDAHRDICEQLEDVDAGENLAEDVLILSDARYYDFGSAWQRILDILPEVLDIQQDVPESAQNPGTYRNGDFRRRLEREYMASESDEVMAKAVLAKQQDCCEVRLLFIEDHETHAADGKRMHAVWLDDFGDVVRENRVTLQEACDYLSIVGEGMGGEDPIWVEGTVGPKYVRGAQFGPPFETSE